MADMAVYNAAERSDRPQHRGRAAATSRPSSIASRRITYGEFAARDPRGSPNHLHRPRSAARGPRRAGAARYSRFSRLSSWARSAPASCRCRLNTLADRRPVRLHSGPTPRAAVSPSYRKHCCRCWSKRAEKLPGIEVSSSLAPPKETPPSHAASRARAGRTTVFATAATHPDRDGILALFLGPRPGCRKAPGTSRQAWMATAELFRAADARQCARGDVVYSAAKLFFSPTGSAMCSPSRCSGRRKPRCCSTAGRRPNAVCSTCCGAEQPTIFCSGPDRLRRDPSPIRKCNARGRLATACGFCTSAGRGAGPSTSGSRWETGASVCDIIDGCRLDRDAAHLPVEHAERHQVRHCRARARAGLRAGALLDEQGARGRR